MTSYILDKLEKLKNDENIIKEKKRVLEEELELEIEKKRRLEMDCTIIKLQTQLDGLKRIKKMASVCVVSDIFPMFTTLLGILKKQHKEIYGNL